MIDWKRVAKPQQDMYDSHVIAQLDVLWKRAPHDDAGVYLADTVLVVPTGSAHYNDPTMLPVNEQCTQEWADAQTQYLNAWQPGYAALQAYLDEFWPFRTGREGQGCSSGHHRLSRVLPIHAVYVSIDDPNGCAEGIYHEVAHCRLESLGIEIDRHDGRLLTNPATALFDSSVRFDCKRPMSAVLHGVYAWLMFTENDLMNRCAGRISHNDFRTYVGHNLPKILKGVEEIRAYATFTDEGVQFIDGVFEWANALVTTCTEKLK